jgi:hypothetical protein
MRIEVILLMSHGPAFEFCISNTDAATFLPKFQLGVASTRVSGSRFNGLPRHLQCDDKPGKTVKTVTWTNCPPIPKLKLGENKRLVFTQYW